METDAEFDDEFMGTPDDWSAPDWSVDDCVHNWRNYPSRRVKAMWASFSDEQKQALAAMFRTMASNEHWD